MEEKTSDEKIILVAGDGKKFEVSKARFATRARFIGSYLKDFDTNEVELKPIGDTAFSSGALEKMIKWIDNFPEEIRKLPKKPLVDFVNWELYMEKKLSKPINEFFSSMTDFYEYVDLFKAAKYAEVADLREIIAAKIAYQIIVDRESPEDLLRHFGLVTQYEDFFSVDQEKEFRDKEFALPEKVLQVDSKKPFEDAAVEEEDDENVPS